MRRLRRVKELCKLASKYLRWTAGDNYQVTTISSGQTQNRIGVKHLARALSTNFPICGYDDCCFAILKLLVLVRDRSETPRFRTVCWPQLG